MYESNRYRGQGDRQSQGGYRGGGSGGGGGGGWRGQGASRPPVQKDYRVYKHHSVTVQINDRNRVELEHKTIRWVSGPRQGEEDEHVSMAFMFLGKDGLWHLASKLPMNVSMFGGNPDDPASPRPLQQIAEWCMTMYDDAHIPKIAPDGSTPEPAANTAAPAPTAGPQ